MAQSGRTVVELAIPVINSQVDIECFRAMIVYISLSLSFISFSCWFFLSIVFIIRSFYPFLSSSCIFASADLFQFIFIFAQSHDMKNKNKVK